MTEEKNVIGSNISLYCLKCGAGLCPDSKYSKAGDSFVIRVIPCNNCLAVLKREVINELKESMKREIGSILDSD